MKTRESRSGFTLLELLVVLGVIGVWICLLTPVVARTGPDTRSALCQNNLRQLTLAWTIYSSDYSGRLPLNNFTSLAVGGQNTTGWITGWLDWTSSSDNTNTFFIADERYAKLASYFGRAPRLFKCPADDYKSAVNRGPRVRSISMDASLGASSDGSKESFLSGAFVAKSVSDLVKPEPAGVWVLADEQADSINDGCLMNKPTQYTWVDLPAAYHGGAGSFSFADGHTELRRWVETSTLVPVAGYYDVLACPGSRDFAWLAGHMPAQP